MTDLDDLLARWKTRLARMDENLLALESEPVYQVLVGTAGGPPVQLEGVTRERVKPALDALSQLFEHRARLTDVVDRASSAREALTFWNKEERLAEIDRLLNGPSILLGAAIRPLAERGLLDPASDAEAVAPEQLLTAMAHAFEVAKRAVLDVKQAWQRVEAAVEEAERAVSGVRERAASLGLASEVAAEVSGITAELAALHGRIGRDPLGISLETGRLAGNVSPALARLSERLDALAELRERAGDELQRAQDLHRRIHEARDRAAAARARVVERIAEAASLEEPTAPDDVAQLEVWRARLKTTADAGRWEPALTGLARWFEAARAHLTRDRGIAQAAEGLEAQRAELEGRLRARLAQAAALATRGRPVDAAALAKARSAEEVLRRRPAPLSEAGRLLAEFEAALRP